MAPIQNNKTTKSGTNSDTDSRDSTQKTASPPLCISGGEPTETNNVNSRDSAPRIECSITFYGDESFEATPKSVSPPSSISGGESIKEYAAQTVTASYTPTNIGRSRMGPTATARELFAKSKMFRERGRSCDSVLNDNNKDHSFDTIQELNNKIELMERQVADLTQAKQAAESHNELIEKKFKVLQMRYHMLEDKYKDAEMRAETEPEEEQKRLHVAITRVERKAKLEIDNCEIKIQCLENEANALRDQTQDMRAFRVKQTKNLQRTDEQLKLAQFQIEGLQKELDMAQQCIRRHEATQKATIDLMAEVTDGLEELPPLLATAPGSINRVEQLKEEVKVLRLRKNDLEDENTELKSAIIKRDPQTLQPDGNSLEEELESSYDRLKQALADKENENADLRQYIETIVFNIVENSPELLELVAIERK